MSVIAEGGLTVEHVAALFGVSERTIARWQNAARDPLPILKQGSGRIRTEYDPRAVFLWALKRQDADTLSCERERALNLRADTRLKELKAQQLQNELAPIDLLQETLGVLAAHITAILKALPQNIHSATPTLTESNVSVIQSVIEKCKAACDGIRIDIS